MWGQVKDKNSAEGVVRIIPTRVGTSFLWRKKKPIYEDHPHACGDKTIIIIAIPVFVGSSPRVWGQVPHFTSAPIKIRIIPTRVGTRSPLSFFVTFCEDHPHACGDKLLICVSKIIRSGIIPTRVGTSSSWSIMPVKMKDHPHACGDKYEIACYFLLISGSSPRVWGQVTVVHNGKIGVRIIPTRVGTS